MKPFSPNQLMEKVIRNVFVDEDGKNEKIEIFRKENDSSMSFSKHSGYQRALWRTERS